MTEDQLGLEVKKVLCKYYFCDKPVEIEVAVIVSGEDDCLGVVCEECEKHAD